MNSKYLFEFRFFKKCLFTRKLQNISFTFLAIMPKNVNSFKFDIFEITIFWVPKIKIVKHKSEEIKLI